LRKVKIKQNEAYRFIIATRNYLQCL